MMLPRTATQDVATSRLPCAAADVSLPNHKQLHRHQCPAFRCTRPAVRPQSSHRLLCRAEIAEADVGPSTSAETQAILDFGTEASSASVPTSETWELDFSSRPILDSRGKKRWELLICSPDRSWVYSKWFPNNKINSTQLKQALADIISQQGAQAPQRVRFFRGQMQTIISRALTDLDIKPVPSRRCFALIGLLEKRIETVYKQAPGYSEKATSLFVLDLGPPQDLPDALRGESWLFVQLPLSMLQQELKSVDSRAVFGDSFNLSTAGLSDLPEDTLIPGIAVYSRRATPLAAWTSGLEVANVVADADRACLVLETGVNQRWRYGNYRRSAENTADARAWEAAKIGARGLHFLAVQKDEDAEDSAGLWLLQSRDLPKI